MVDVPSLRLDVPLLDDERADLQAHPQTSLINRPAGTVLIGEDELDIHALLILKGVVKVMAGRPRPSVYLRGPGDVVGERAAISRKPRSATVVALTDVQALYIPGGVWVEFLLAHPRAALAQNVALDERLVEATRKSRDSVLANERKFAKAILALAAMALGEPTAEGLSLRFSQKDLAEIAGISGESAKDIVGLLKARGIVLTGRQRIVVHDLAAVRAIACGDATASA